MNVWIPRTIGIILIILPFVVIVKIITEGKQIPILGSPLILIVWASGITLLLYKFKK